MKKFLILLLALLLVVCLFTACAPEPGSDVFVSSRFKTLWSLSGGDLSNCTLQEVVAVDTSTNVMYLVVYSAYHLGITPLYNSDGSVMIYDGTFAVMPPYDPED